MIRRGKLNLKNCKIVVVDEADEMLSQGFKEQIYDIFNHLPKDVQVALFSATLPYEINGLTDKFMRNPVKILVKTDQLTLEGIDQSTLPSIMTMRNTKHSKTSTALYQ